MSDFDLEFLFIDSGTVGRFIFGSIIVFLDFKADCLTMMMVSAPFLPCRLALLLSLFSCLALRLVMLSIVLYLDGSYCLVSLFDSSGSGLSAPFFTCFSNLSRRTFSYVHLTASSWILLILLSRLIVSSPDLWLSRKSFSKL